MPRRSRDNLGFFFPNTLTTSNIKPSLFFSGCGLEEPLGEQPYIFEEPIGEKKKKTFFWSKQRKTEMLGAVPYPKTNLQIRWNISRAR